LRAGLPWAEGVSITPLPEPQRPAYLEALVADAVGKGARVVNPGGGERRGALFTPAVVYPVTPDMRLWQEEQFGPVVPVGTFKDPVREVGAAAMASWSGQQAAVFTKDPSGAEAGPIVDALATIVGRINVNSQCQRGPDSLPFSGRRSSAMGTMSVTEALRAFSVETVVAFPAADGASEAAVRGIEAASKFLAPL
jgi:glyceraldehyde-3-phosphate dehydrogenase (NADP+)